MSPYEKAIRDDLKNFVFTAWHFLGLPDPTPIQYQICDELQYGANKRRLICGFRGCGKSFLTSAYVCWRLLNDKELKFLIVSASKSRSDAFSTFTKRLIAEMPILQHLQPDGTQRDSMVAFDVAGCRPAHAPSVKAAGVFGQLTGSRASEIISDDCEISNNSATQDARDKLANAIKEFEAVVIPGGRITFLGTPQSEESLYNTLPDRGYSVMIWPARVPLENKIASYNGRLTPYIYEGIEKGTLKYGEPLDPMRFHEQDLIEREASYGRSGFALQFQLDTTLSDAERYPLKLSDLVVLPLGSGGKAPISFHYGSTPDLQLKDYINPGFTGDRFHRAFFVDMEWAKYEGSVMAIDPSGRGNDETGYAIVNQLHGSLFVLAAGGLKGGYDEPTLTQLAKIAKEHKVNYIIIESNFGDGMYSKLFTPILMRYHPCSIEEVRHNTQKEKRIIDTLEPVMNRHKLVVSDSVVKEDLKTFVDSGDTIENFRNSLFYQLTHLTKDRGSLRHDDRLDALSMAVAYWVDSMGRDEEAAVKSWKDEQLDADLRGFIDSCLSTQGKPGKSRWF